MGGASPPCLVKQKIHRRKSLNIKDLRTAGGAARKSLTIKHLQTLLNYLYNFFSLLFSYQLLYYYPYLHYLAIVGKVAYCMYICIIWEKWGNRRLAHASPFKLIPASPTVAPV